MSMNHKPLFKMKKFKFPPIGQRIVRSTIAVALCFVIYYLRGKQGIPFYTALAVLQCIQPYTTSTKKMAKNRTTGTLVGAFWGFIVIMISLAFHGGMGHTLEESFLRYMLISLFTGVVLYSTVVLDVKQSSYFSCVVFLSITVMHMGDESPLLFVFNRVLDTEIGILLAMMINSIHLPRTKNNDILFVSGIDDTILDSHSALTPYSKVELNRLIDEGAKFTVSTIRTPASVREGLEGIHLKLPMVVMDGAVLYDMNENQYLMKYEMSGAQASRIAYFLDDFGIEYYTNTVVDNLLVIYYRELSNDASRDVYEMRRKSPYRNYVRSEIPVCEHVLYYYIIDKKDTILRLYRSLLEQEWIEEYRIVYQDSRRYNGYAHIKIYQKDATRENMVQNLKALLNLEKVVTFGSVEGKYDVLIDDADHNIMVKELKRLYEPVKFIKSK